MKDDVDGDHPLRRYFATELHRSLRFTSGSTSEAVEDYLSRMLVQFLSYDDIYRIRDNSGRRIRSVVEMLPEGDITQQANSFEREREVHKHIGDYLLFVSGMFPEFLRGRLHSPVEEALVDPVAQGRQSYSIAGSFDYGEFATEAPVFRSLSQQFEEYVFGLRMIRNKFRGIGST
jgi:hypothetical protein